MLAEENIIKNKQSYFCLLEEHKDNKIGHIERNDSKGLSSNTLLLSFLPHTGTFYFH